MMCITIGSATVNLSWLLCMEFIFIYLFFLQVTVYTQLVAILTRSQENSSAMMHVKKKGRKQFSTKQMPDEWARVQSWKTLNMEKSLLAYACATLRRHNENKIRGKVVISLESVARFDIREVITLSLVLLVGHLNTFLALQLWCIFS